MATQRVLESKLTKWYAMRLLERGKNQKSHANYFGKSVQGRKSRFSPKSKNCMEECDHLIEDVNKSVSGMQHAFLSGQKSPTRGELKRLIKHDHDVIDMVTKAVNLANSAEQSIALQEGKEQQLVLHTTQLVTSCRGFLGSSKYPGRTKPKEKKEVKK